MSWLGNVFLAALQTIKRNWIFFFLNGQAATHPVNILLAPHADSMADMVSVCACVLTNECSLQGPVSFYQTRSIVLPVKALCP